MEKDSGSVFINQYLFLLTMGRTLKLAASAIQGLGVSFLPERIHFPLK